MIGIKKNGNVHNCRYYSDCNEIANICGASNIFKLEDGYVDSI